MFELANGGTILLDEIGDMDVRLQAKLLQVLQDHEFQRIGGKETVKVDVRVMAATHRDLETRHLANRSFREDLYYRLNVVNLQVPPLRERKEDIVPLAEFLLKKHAIDGVPMPAITFELKQAMLAYPWPGNVRELENVMRKLIVLRNSQMIAAELNAKTIGSPAPAAPAESHWTPATLRLPSKFRIPSKTSASSTRRPRRNGRPKPKPSWPPSIPLTGTAKKPPGCSKSSTRRCYTR